MIFKKRKLSISKKLTFIYSIILFSILIFFTLLTFFTISNIIVKDSEMALSESADILSNYVNTMKGIDDQAFNNISLGQGVFYSVFDNNKNLIYSNDTGGKVVGKHLDDKRNNFRDSKFQRVKGSIFTSRTVSNKNKVYYIELNKNFEDIGAKTGALSGILIITSILGTMVAFVSGSFLTKKLLEPIKNISNTAKEITSKSLDKRISTEGPDDELKDLAATFNSMIERLQGDFEKQRRFVSDASHELRTPLAVIHGHVNMLNRWGKDEPEVLNKSLSTLKLETDNMNRLIESLMYLAKGDNNVIEMRKEEVNINILLKEVVDETLLSNSEYSVSYNCEKGINIETDYNAVKQVLRILVDNSIKFSKPQGKIVIKAESDQTGVFISVEDEGVGIPSDSLPYIFDRFYRVDESRSKTTGGTGLGLSIAKQIIQSLGGRISAESEIGKWTKITVYIPSTQCRL